MSNNNNKCIDCKKIRNDFKVSVLCRVCLEKKFSDEHKGAIMLKHEQIEYILDTLGIKNRMKRGLLMNICRLQYVKQVKNDMIVTYAYDYALSYFCIVKPLFDMVEITGNSFYESPCTTINNMTSYVDTEIWSTSEETEKEKEKTNDAIIESDDDDDAVKDIAESSSDEDSMMSDDDEEEEDSESPDDFGTIHDDKTLINTGDDVPQLFTLNSRVQSKKTKSFGTITSIKTPYVYIQFDNGKKKYSYELNKVKELFNIIPKKYNFKSNSNHHKRKRTTT